MFQRRHFVLKADCSDKQFNVGESVEENHLPKSDPSKFSVSTWQGPDCYVNPRLILLNPLGFHITGIAN